MSVSCYDLWYQSLDQPKGQDCLNIRGEREKSGRRACQANGEEGEASQCEGHRIPGCERHTQRSARYVKAINPAAGICADAKGAPGRR
jgi:hypothetical protein